MDSIPVNWEALDSLIIDFVKSENLIEDSVSPSASPSTSLSPSSSTSSSSSYSHQSRLLIRQIRRSVEYGDIDVAIDLLRVHALFVLDDHRLLFCLQKQDLKLIDIQALAHAVELTRQGAIDSLRFAKGDLYQAFQFIRFYFWDGIAQENAPAGNQPYSADLQCPKGT